MHETKASAGNNDSSAKKQKKQPAVTDVHFYNKNKQ